MTYLFEECTIWMEGTDLCRNCPDEGKGNTVHPDGYGCYIKKPIKTAGAEAHSCDHELGLVYMTSKVPDKTRSLPPAKRRQ